MRRVAAYTALLIAATIIVVMFFTVGGRKGECESTCGLMYGNKVDGVVRYAYENGDYNSTVLERLNNMRDTWLSADFRLRVFHRAHALCQGVPTNELMKTISTTVIEIRPRKVAVRIRSTGPSQEVASACARSFSREIVESTVALGNRCREIGVAQLRRNYERQERYMSSLQKELQRIKEGATNAEHEEIKNIQDKLDVQRKKLDSMKSDIVAAQNVDCWCGFFVEMDESSVRHL